MPELRLLTLDAAAFADRHAVARAIAGHEPDVAVVHGAPSLLRWRSTCAAVAREAGLVVVGAGAPRAARWCSPTWAWTSRRSRST